MNTKELIVFQSLSIQETLESLKTKPLGLTQEESTERLLLYGPNKITQEHHFSIPKAITRSLRNPFSLVLLGAVTLSLVSGHSGDAIVILIIIAINTTIDVHHQKKAHLDIELLKKSAPHFATVIRDNTKQRIIHENLVPGDIVVLEEGSLVPADGRIIESLNLGIDESALTGESTPVQKTTTKIPANTPLLDATNMTWLGSMVSFGYGMMVVTKTGAKTQFGILEKTLSSLTRGNDPFLEKIKTLTKTITLIGIIVVVLLFTLRFFILEHPFGEMLMFSLALLVLIIPESLPTIINITLSRGARYLAKESAVVKELSSIESIGATSIIVTDKTGTLTENSMKVEYCFLPSHQEYNVTGFGWSSAGMFMQENKPANYTKDEELSLLLDISILMSRAHISANEKGDYVVIGEPTEAAMMVFGQKGNRTQEELLATKYDIVKRPVFFQHKKLLLGVIKRETSYMLVAMGAPESIEGLASVDQTTRTKIHDYATKGFRTIACAFKTINKDTFEEDDLHSMTFGGVLAMQDPIRNGVKEAIIQAKDAGIRIIMATGDHKQTAEYIAREIGIINKSFPNVIDGATFLAMDEKQQKEVLKNTNVFARVTPETKQIIIDILQKNKGVVTMVGDGINDALALRRASVGVAMGLSGTDVAKNASALVLTNDNFITLISAIFQGRHISINVRQVTNFLLSTNGAEALIFIVATFLGLPLPLIAIQILIINLVTDGIGALPFAFKKPESRAIRKLSSRVLSRFDIGMIASSAIGMTIATIITFQIGLEVNLVYAQSLAFITLVFTQVGRLIGFETYDKPITTLRLKNNPWLLRAVFISLGVSVVLFIVPEIRMFTGLEIPRGSHIASAFALGFLPLITIELYKSLHRKFSKPLRNS